MKDKSSDQNEKSNNPYKRNPQQPDNDPYRPYRNNPEEEPENLEEQNPRFPLGWLTASSGYVYIDEIVVYYSLN